jgi:Fe-Mn family superoxide dismutase
MKLISNISNWLFWVFIIVGFIFVFTIPTSKKVFNIKKIKKQIYDDLKYPFELPKLKFDYKALESYIDEKTLNIHHTKHHQGYIDSLNKVMEAFPEYQKYSLEELLSNLNALPEALSKAVKSFGGGHFNHNFFWDALSSKPNLNNEPSELLLEKINKTFKSFEGFKQDFLKQALSIVGSGWVWLCVDQAGELVIIPTYNHETPYALKMQPILLLDVWEHAYYLKYQNRRAEFVAAWWNLIDWKFVERIYFKFMQK